MSTRANTRGWYKDGCADFSGGIDGSRPSFLLDPDQSGGAINTTFRGGPARNRPGFKKLPLTFHDSGTQSAFQSPNGPFQHARPFDGAGYPTLISSQAGRQFLFDITRYSVREITPFTGFTTSVSVSFNIPASGSTLQITVASTSGMTLNSTQISLGPYYLTLVSIDSANQITVQNNVASQNGVFIGAGSVVGFQGLDINNPNLTIGWSEQVENYWVYQDNVSLPIIFDGSTSVRSNQSENQIPVGNVMCYTQGRLAVALPDRYSFRVGDLVFGSSGTIQNQDRDAPLYFTENTYLNEGGDFQARVFGAPSQFGPILSMKAGAMTDTALGQGPLLVGQAYMVFSVQLPFDRTTWKDLTQAMQTANPVNGPLGQDSTVLINTDMWYRRIDGIGSYITAQRQFNGSWINTPMSAEISDFLDNDTSSLLENGSGVFFGNRLLETVSPVNSPYGIYHRGLAVLDFDLVSTIRKRSGPCWEGIWTGLKILKILKCNANGVERCFLYCLGNATNQIEIWELDLNALFDEGPTPIQWSIDLRSMICGDIDQFKRLETGRIGLTDINGAISGVITYRTDRSPCYQPWDSFSICAANADCGPPACAGPHTYREQARVPIDLFMPPDTYDPIAHRKYRTGYQFQPRMENVGAFAVESFRIFALDQPENLTSRRTTK